MRDRLTGKCWWLAWCVVSLVAVVQVSTAGQRRSSVRLNGLGGCKVAVVEGEVSAGKSFVREIGGGLEVRLQALSWGSGWLLRVVPTSQERMERDYAGLATPPYESVNPLLLSTDFSFRAQDAVAWNPRRFHFASSATEFLRLRMAYERFSKESTPTVGAQNELAWLASRAQEGTLQILDARLVPGTANQAGTAALVATHFSTTAHLVEEPAAGKGTALGKLSWVRFRVSLNLPGGFVPKQALAVEPVKCP